MTDYNQPFFEDYLLPGGDLRESRSGADRADVIIVTKCPSEIPEDRLNVFHQKIKLKNYSAEVGNDCVFAAGA